MREIDSHIRMLRESWWESILWFSSNFQSCSHYLSNLKEPLYSIFSSTIKTPFQKSKNSNLLFKSLWFVNFLLPRPENCPKYSSGSLHLSQKSDMRAALLLKRKFWHQFSKPSNVAPTYITSSPFSALWAAHPYQNESWVPLRPDPIWPPLNL